MLSLVVDDDRTVRAFVRAVLRQQGFETVEAEGGNQALEIVKEKGVLLDLIVTDVQMPDGDGLTCVGDDAQAIYSVLALPPASAA